MSDDKTQSQDSIQEGQLIPKMQKVTTVDPVIKGQPVAQMQPRPAPATSTQSGSSDAGNGTQDNSGSKK